MGNLKHLGLFVFFFAPACERLFITTHSTESRCYKTRKYTVCRHVHASFSPEILQAGAVKGLTSTETTRLIRDGKMGGMEVGGEVDYIPIATLLPSE